MTAKKFADEVIYNHVVKLHYDLEKHHFGKLNQRDAVMVNLVTKDLLNVANDLYTARKEMIEELYNLSLENKRLRELLSDPEKAHPPVKQDLVRGRLIEAAPDLLAACMGIYAAICAIDPEEWPDELDGSIADQLAKAIAKARGE